MAIDPQLIAPALAPQIILSSNEAGRLTSQIQSDFRNALGDHDVRMRRFARYYQRFRNRPDQPSVGEETASNFRVPLMQWQVFGKWADQMAKLLGDDAEIVAKPVGPSNQKRVRKVSRYMTWMVFDSMKLPNKIATFIFRGVLNGRSHAYAPWQRDSYWVPLVDGTEAEEVYYEGPGFEDLNPDDLIVPAEEARSIQDFSFVIRKYRATPDSLLRGEEQGRYQGIKKNWDTIVNFASHKRQRDWDSELVKREQDLAEGVQYEGAMSAANSIWVHEWYGRWRRLKGKADGSVNNFDRRNLRESELVVAFAPELHMLLGCQDLALMYPRSPQRRPFVEYSMTKDGSYWCQGLGELLESMEDELSANHNLMTEAGEISVGPVLIYKPGSGFDPATFTYAPKTAIASEDPASVRVVEIKANLEYPIAKEQAVVGYAERVTGLTDMALGRAIDRPNAPKTARQTLALLSEGDVRANLDVSAMREDMATVLSRFWDLSTMFAQPDEFFRVTEEDAGGLFDVKDGGAWMTAEDRAGRYDFDIRFATTAWSKESRKQDTLAMYQLDLTNPLVQQNPRALWNALDRVHRAFGDDQFSEIVPQPPDPGLPVDPKVENALAEEGEEIKVNPLDNDQLHIIVHSDLIDQLGQDPEANQTVLNDLIRHRIEHMDQIRQKQLLATLATAAVQTIGSHLAGGAQGMPPGAPNPALGAAGAPGLGVYRPPMSGSPGAPAPGGPPPPLPKPPGPPPGMP